MSGPAGAAVDAYSKVNDWMSPLSGLLDELMRPLVEPLAEQLEFVTGDPEGLQSAADIWVKQADELRDLIADQRRDRADLAHEWSGDAARRFMEQLVDLEAEFEAEAADMEATAELLREAAEECRVIQDMVETVIRELIEWALITLAASAAFAALTAGISHSDREPGGAARSGAEENRGCHEGSQSGSKDEQVQPVQTVDMEACRRLENRRWTGCLRCPSRCEDHR